MKNYIQKGDNITVASPGNVASGDGVMIGEIFGVAAGDAETGEDLDLVCSGIFDIAKKATDAFDVGEAVQWSNADKCVDDATKPRIGVAVKAAGNPSATVRVKLEPVQQPVGA